MARIAKALDVLRAQVQATIPRAPKSEFGWLGDARHRKRKSDHNPNSEGVVLALDIPHYPKLGLNTYELADYMIAHPDPRARYVISNGRIAGNELFVNQNRRFRCPGPWQWGVYDGANKHDRHMHVSASRLSALYDDTAEWDLAPLHEEMKMMAMNDEPEEQEQHEEHEEEEDLRVSKNGLELIKAFESCLRPVKGKPGFFRTYIDPVGVATIGWGHTNHHPPRIDRNTEWSQDECDEALDRDLDIFEKQVNRLATVPLKQYEFDALVSWAYNTGGPRSSMVWKYVNSKQRGLVVQQLKKWNKGGGRVLSGLTRRRLAEGLMFMGKIEEALKVAHR